MAQVLADDLDQTVSTDKTPVLPWVFTLGPKSAQVGYEIDLTESNFQKIQEALAPFITAARELTDAPPAPGSSSSTGTKTAKRKAEDAKARAWAAETGYKYKGANGEERTIGVKGSVPEVVYKAWVDAGKP